MSLPPIKKTKRLSHDPRGKKLTLNTTSDNPVITLVNRALELTKYGQLKEVADYIGIDQMHLVNIYNEHSNMSIRPLQRLCHSLGLMDGNEIIEIFLSQPLPLKVRQKKERAAEKAAKEKEKAEAEEAAAEQNSSNEVAG